MDPQSTPLSSTPTPQPVTKKKGRFFSLLGKILLFVILAGGLIIGGYFLGIKATPTTDKIAPMPTTEATVSPTEIPPSPTAASQTTKPVKAGLTSTAFKPYTIDVPTGWTDAKETTVAADIDKLTLTKNGYSVTIYQAAMGGGGCVYPSDKPSEMAQSFTDSSDINGKSGQFRRSWNQKEATKTISYTVCQKAADNSYGSLTTFGRIDVVSPSPADTTTLAEIDGMIASMVQQ